MGITLNEIYAQYSSLERTVRLLEKNEEEYVSFFRNAKPRAVLFTGCGSSFDLACSLRSVMSVRMTQPAYALASGDLWLNCGGYRNMLEDALVVSVSRSGQTSEVIKAYQAVQAMNCGTRFLSIVCAADTPLGKLSDLTIEIPWAFDESVCQTRSVANLYAAAAVLIGLWSGDSSVKRDMLVMAEAGPEYLKKIDPVCNEIAAKPWENVVVLADGEIDGLAEEGALAFKEISQIHSNYHHILDVRHGPMVLIGEKTLVLAAVSSPAVSYEMDLIDDLKKKGATIVCYSGGALNREDVTCVSLGENVGTAAGGLGLLAICQLTAYYKSGYVGCNPDEPDGLDAWIQIS